MPPVPFHLARSRPGTSLVRESTTVTYLLLVIVTSYRNAINTAFLYLSSYFEQKGT